MASQAAMRAAQKARALDHVVGEINPLKSRLMALQNELWNAPGCATEAAGLERIIGRLEAWQAKAKRF